MRFIAVLTCVALGLAGCTTYGWEKRYGIDPVLNPVAVRVATSNQILILNALAEDANLGTSGPINWYTVAEAGFNFVDDECRSYFNHLFFLNRDRERNKSFLISGAATTAAILGVTGANTKTMTIVAEAFGFGGVANELIAGTYLYQLPPATTLSFVKEMQLAYREGAANRRALISSSAPAAYHAIQDYLTLCLPPTIEAKMAEHIGAARAMPDSTRGSQSSSFGISLTAPPPVTRQEIRAAVGADVVVQSQPLRQGSDRVRPTARLQERDVERGTTSRDLPLRRDDWALYRATLCVTDEAELGPKTRQALRLFKAAVNDKPAESLNEEMTKRELQLLEEARGRFPTCTRSGPNPPRNAFEVGLYTNASETEVNNVLRRALTLAKRTKADIYSPAPTDPFDTGRAVTELRAFHAIGPLPGMQAAELDDRIWLRSRRRN